jgi:tryptase
MKTKLIYLSLISVFALSACAPKRADHFAGRGEGVINGEPVGEADPSGNSVVALVANMDEGQALCTGSLVAEDTVLTAAHCVDQNPQNLVIVFSRQVKAAGRENMRAAESYVQNPLWNKGAPQGRGDLALIHFSGGLPEGYQPVTLARAGYSPAKGEATIMMGYGVSDAENKTGEGQLREMQTSILGALSGTEFESDGRDSSVCFGDSGGPAFASQGGDVFQWGVASSVSSEACDTSSIHTDVAQYLPWIKNMSASLRKSR